MVCPFSFRLNKSLGIYVQTYFIGLWSSLFKTNQKKYHPRKAFSLLGKL